MTLDEAIEHCKDVARDNRAKAEEEWRAFSIYPFGNVEESATFVDRCDECAEQHEQLAQWLEELKEYEDLEEQGLLLKLPCKVGGTVYVIDKRYTKCSLYDEEYSESSCWNCDKECDSKMYYVVVKRYVGTLEWVVSRLKKFGKTVFLTKEEAEKALKEMEGAE